MINCERPSEPVGMIHYVILPARRLIRLTFNTHGGENARAQGPENNYRCGQVGVRIRIPNNINFSTHRENNKNQGNKR